MSGPTARRPRRTRADRRADATARLLLAAEELTAHGDEAFSAVTVESLATRAGISRATFYIYFEDKGELVRAWFAAVAVELAASVERWWRAERPIEPELIRDGLREVLGVYVHHRTALTAVRDMMPLDAELRELVEAADRARSSVLAEHVRRGQTEGWVGAELAVPETAQWIAVMIDRVAGSVAVTDDDAAAALADAGTVVIARSLRAAVG